MLFAAVDQSLDAVALAVGGTIEARASPVAGWGREHRPDPAPAPVRSGRGAGVALVTDHAARSNAGSAPARSRDRAAFQQRRHRRRLVPLLGGQDVGHRLAVPLGPEVEVGREAAAGAAQGLIAAPFLARAACWWARTVGPSRTCISPKCVSPSRSPWASPAAWSPAKARSQTPARCQRRQRESTVRQGPNRAGRSRQETPVASRHRMPSTTVRSSRRGRPRRGGGGSRGCNRSQCVSLSACRSMPHRIVHFADTP